MTEESVQGEKVRLSEGEGGGAVERESGIRIIILWSEIIIIKTMYYTYLV